MDRPFVGGGDKKYEENYDKIFRGSKGSKLLEFINKVLIKLFLEKRKV